MQGSRFDLDRTWLHLFLGDQPGLDCRWSIEDGFTQLDERWTFTKGPLALDRADGAIPRRGVVNFANEIIDKHEIAPCADIVGLNVVKFRRKFAGGKFGELAH